MSDERGKDPTFIFETDPEDPETLLKEIMEDPPYELTLSLEELFAARKKRKSQKPPRAQNKFILFRKDYIAQARKEDPARTKSMNTRDFSTEAKQQWEDQPAVVHQFFTILANVATKKHKDMYPGYVYEPEKKKDKQVAVSEENLTNDSSDKQAAISEENLTNDSSDKQAAIAEENFMDDSQTVFEENFTDDSSDEFEEYVDYSQCSK
ncbi:22542_t:CDS:1 [Gigaspora margarita]|uniref:22542_t:CDS:1 n=1 Tax=Gigaspora margarita TaxID=4874 RepID=A0ABN7UZD2_GIGMA|nr:22542_t:CDS:1 [Gigaspora margarita]